MIRRLVEQSYISRTGDASAERVDFWLREIRTPELLAALVDQYPALAAARAHQRRAIQAAIVNHRALVALALEEEERDERRKDREYWEPLKRELEVLRREKRSAPGS